MAFYKTGAGMDVKYLCSWDYRVGEKHDGAFQMRPHASCTHVWAWCIFCWQSQGIFPSVSPQNQRVKYLILELLHAREILGVIKTKSFPESLGPFTSMSFRSALVLGWEDGPASLHLQVVVCETLQQCLGKGKSTPRVLAGSSESHCFTFYVLQNVNVFVNLKAAADAQQ